MRLKRNNIKIIEDAIKACLNYLPESDMAAALTAIIFAKDTKINWEYAWDVLQEYVPDMVGQGFTDNTITCQELSDYIDDVEFDIFDTEGLFDRYPNADPSASLTFSDAIDLLYTWFVDRFADDDATTNYAYAAQIVRGAFKQYTFY